jgi:hypothetical protein
MTRLSNTQLTILSTAAQRPDGNLLPLPDSLRGGAATKVVGALLGRGLVREEVTDGTRPANAAFNTIWRNEEDGRAVLLRITAAGLKALGIEPAASPIAEAPQRPGAGHTDSPASVESLDPATAQGPSASHTAPLRGKTREGTKQAALIAMLQRPEGATIGEVVEATGLQPHTVRGALAGALKKRLGLTIASEKSRPAGGFTGWGDPPTVLVARPAARARRAWSRNPAPGAATAG